MFVPVVRVGVVRMAVRDRLVPVVVAVPRARRHRRFMHMLMMRVAGAMHMFMRMLQGLMPVAVFVAL